MCVTKACQGVSTSIQVQELNRSNPLCNLQIVLQFFNIEMYTFNIFCIDSYTEKNGFC